MTVYISGPMSGMRDLNRRAFEKAVKKIAVISPPETTIINPLKISEMVELSFTKENQKRFIVKKPQWSDYMRADIQKLCESDCVYFLRGWEKSKGACLERHIALALEIPCAETTEQLCAIWLKLFTGGKNGNP
jgi:hypothetical protein